MAQQFQVTGRVPISVGTGTSGALEFLGYSEDQFSIDVHGVFEDVNLNAAGGVPADKQWMGDYASVSFTLARYEESVLRKLEARPNPGGTAGAYAANLIGSLMIQEGYAVRVLFDLLYQSKAAFAGLPPAFNFLKGFVEGPISRPVGTKVTSPRLTFTFLPLIDYAAGTATLYNSATTGKPTYS